MLQKIIHGLGFSRSEARGFVIFFLILFAIAVAPYVFERYFISYSPLRIEELQVAINQIDQFDDQERPKQRDFSVADFDNRSELFAFDPNSLPIEDWVRLGLTEKQARAIKNYEAKGGKFYRKEDVRKMYVISDKQYKRLEPYILIPKKGELVSSSDIEVISPERKKSKAVMVELNTVDSAGLLQVAGIGPVFASRILKYRERLGGVIHESQLSEVWGMDSVRLGQIRNQIRIDASAVKKININSDTEQIKRLPYLNYKQKNAIIAYRKQHGDYKELNDLKKIVLLNEENLQKIAPYVKFND